MPEKIKVDIWSDIACPWCYIGKRHFEKAIALFSEQEGSIPVDVEYRSFELSPDTPIDFEGSELEFLSRHKGVSPDRAQAMIDRVTSIAAEAGLAYDYGSLQHTNTVKAHQALHHAKSEGRQTAMKERLLSAYFVEGRHLGRDVELAGLAEEVGLDGEGLVEALRDQRHLGAVRADQDQARQLGIGGVPFFVFNMEFGLSGAQPPEVFKRALTQAGSDS